MSATRGQFRHCHRYRLLRSKHCPMTLKKMRALLVAIARRGRLTKLGHVCCSKQPARWIIAATHLGESSVMIQGYSGCRTVEVCIISHKTFAARDLADFLWRRLKPTAMIHSGS